MNQTERRHFPRCPANLLLQVRNSQSNIDGYCVAISEGGLAAILPETISEGVEVLLRLALPTHSTVLEIRAVVRSRREICHGFEFVSLPEPARAAIQQFCKPS